MILAPRPLRLAPLGLMIALLAAPAASAAPTGTIGAHPWLGVQRMCCDATAFCPSEVTFAIPNVATACPGSTWRVGVATVVDGDPTKASPQCDESLDVFLKCDDGLTHLGTTPDWNGCKDVLRGWLAGPWTFTARQGCTELIVRHSATGSCATQETLYLTMIRLFKVIDPVESCNGLDDDCDGAVDEDYPLLGQACDGQDADQCANGAWVCNPDQTGIGDRDTPPFPYICAAETPEGVVETCNGLDDDCDGAVDEDATDAGGACDTGSPGPCAAGVQVCAGGVLQCEGAAPSIDVCNGIDDDCNGVVDDGAAGAVPCDTGLPGECGKGMMTCVDGESSCVGKAQGPEVCDGMDNDCDGATDEGLGQTTCGVGACMIMIANCKDGAPQTCVPVEPADEICNGKDDDCDGLIDEALGQTTCGVGACATVIDNCKGGAPQECIPAEPGDEVCNDLDDDCDGAVDEGALCDDGDPCTDDVCGGVGGCANPQNAAPCDDGDPCTTGDVCAGGQCAGAGTDEVCDGADNDCDGETDEGFDVGAACVVDPCGLGLPSPGATVIAVSGDGGDEFPVAASGDGWALIGTTFGDNLEHNYQGKESLVDFLLDVMLTQSKSDQPAVVGFFAAYDPGDVAGMLSLLQGFYDQGYLSSYDGMDVSEVEPLDLTPADLAGIDIVFLDAASDSPQADFFVLTEQALQTLLDFQANGGVIIGSAYTMVHWTNYYAWERVVANPHLAQLFGGTLPDITRYAHKGVTADGDDLLTLTAVQPWLPLPDNPWFHAFWALDVTLAPPPSACVSQGVFACTPDGAAQCDAPPVGSAELCGNDLDDDCDCAVDEGFEALGEACAAGVGACEAGGTWMCAADLLTLDCDAMPGAPGDEVCNGVDDDCDGLVDEDAPCDDGDPCTTGDVCSDGACVGGAPIGCDDGDPCTDDWCDGGCQHADNDACACSQSLEIVSDPQTWANGAPAVPTWSTNARWTAQIPGATWIWTEYLLSDPINDTFAHFTRTVVIPPGAVGVQATLIVSADNSYTIAVNGAPAGASPIETNYFSTLSYDIGALLAPGINTVEFDVHNWAQAGGTPTSNPAGLLYKLQAAWLAPGELEVCDGLDNDCDGLTDEDLGTLTCGVGDCEVTVDACAGGALQACEPLQGSDEVCDGADNDCDGAIDEGFATGDACIAGDPCGYGMGGVPAVVHPCVELGVTACGADGQLACEPTGCHPATVWQLGTFHFEGAPGIKDPARAGAVEYPATDAWTSSFDYTVDGAGSLAPDMPGYLHVKKMSLVDPKRALTDAAAELNLHFELQGALTDAVVHWSRYGSEANTLFLDDAPLLTTSGAEAVNSVHEVPLPPLAAGWHVLSVSYDGGGASNGNYIDAIRLVATLCGAPAPELCGNGVDDDCDCSIDEGFEDAGAACTVGGDDGALTCTADGLDLECLAP